MFILKIKKEIKETEEEIKKKEENKKKMEEEIKKMKDGNKQIVELKKNIEELNTKIEELNNKLIELNKKLNKPKPNPGMKEITDKETQSSGKVYLLREMPEMEKDLKISVPQARLIHGNEVMNFEVEYTPDQASYWYGGKYLFSFSFPEDFPYKPPKVMCKTKIYHPNIDYDGNVCLNMLKDDWNATYTALSCVSGVYYLFSEPNPNDPLNHDVAKIMRDNLSQFKDNVKRTLRGGYQFGQDFPRFTKY